MVNKKYRVGYKVGEGAFGLVYAGTIPSPTISE